MKINGNVNAQEHVVNEIDRAARSKHELAFVEMFPERKLILQRYIEIRKEAIESIDNFITEGEKRKRKGWKGSPSFTPVNSNVIKLHRFATKTHMLRDGETVGKMKKYSFNAHRLSYKRAWEAVKSEEMFWDPLFDKTVFAFIKHDKRISTLHRIHYIESSMTPFNIERIIGKHDKYGFFRTYLTDTKRHIHAWRETFVNEWMKKNIYWLDASFSKYDGFTTTHNSGMVVRYTNIMGVLKERYDKKRVKKEIEAAKIITRIYPIESALKFCKKKMNFSFKDEVLKGGLMKSLVEMEKPYQGLREKRKLLKAQLCLGMTMPYQKLEKLVKGSTNEEHVLDWTDEFHRIGEMGTKAAFIKERIKK